MLYCAQKSLTGVLKTHSIEFPLFEQAWHTGRISNRHSHGTERDCWEREAATSDEECLQEMLERLPSPWRSSSNRWVIACSSPSLTDATRSRLAGCHQDWTSLWSCCLSGAEDDAIMSSAGEQLPDDARPTEWMNDSTLF